MNQHLVVDMIVSTKYIQNSSYLLSFGYFGLN
jgi:hypothetical protein